MRTREELDRERKSLSDADREFYFRDDTNQYMLSNGELTVPTCGSMYPEFDELFALTPPSLRKGLDGVFLVNDDTSAGEYPEQFTEDDITDSNVGDVWLLLKPGFTVTCFDADDNVYDAKALFVHNRRMRLPIWQGCYWMLLDGGYETVAG